VNRFFAIKLGLRLKRLAYRCWPALRLHQHCVTIWNPARIDELEVQFAELDRLAHCTPEFLRRIAATVRGSQPLVALSLEGRAEQAEVRLELETKSRRSCEWIPVGKYVLRTIRHQAKRLEVIA
jgi:hypothetical protein